MKKNGFTLVELLVVIAIIAILSIIIIPSVVTVNKNVNERLYKQKIENIESAAELYASNNPDIFNGADRVYVFVYQLIDANYLEIDTKNGSGGCVGAENINNGCITDPRASSDDIVMNNDRVLLIKKNVGVVGEYVDDDNSERTPSSEKTLVDAVCNGFDNGDFLGVASTNRVGEEYDTCACTRDASGNVTGLKRTNGGSAPEMCMIVSSKDSGDVDNWLKYGSSKANWRVLGVYKIGGTVYPKMITSDVVQ